MISKSKQRIPTNASSREIANSIYETIDKIKSNGETPYLKEELQFGYARLKLSEGELDDSYKIFGMCNSITIDNNLRENYEIYYWIGRISELKMEYQKALSTYELALKRCTDDPLLIPRNEILDAIENLKTKM
jgi:hypothetical protein